MPFDRRRANEHLEPPRDMGFGSESKRSSNLPHNSKIVKEKDQLPQASRRLKNQGKLKVKNSIALPYGEPGKDKIHSTLIQTKSLGDYLGESLKCKPTKEDELIRYMSNLPGYLQRVDNGENLQEKALNVGVLDWARLEKWKHHRKPIPTLKGNDVSSASSISSLKTNTKTSALSSAVPKDVSAKKSKEHSTCSSISSSLKDGLPRGPKLYTQKIRHFQDIETASKSTLDQQKKTSKTYNSFGKTYSDVIIEEEKKREIHQKVTSEMGNMSSNTRNHGISPLSKETANVCNGGTKNRVDQREEIVVNEKDLYQKNMSDVKVSSSKSRNYAVSLGSRKTLSAESDKTKKKETQESEIGLAHQYSTGERKNIVLLLPKSARNSFFEEPQELLDGTSNEANQDSFSYDFLRKVSYGELSSEVPNSCPLPCGVEINSETDMMAEDLEPSSNAFHGSACSNNTENIRSQDKCSAKSKIKSQDADVEALKILEEEMAELATRKSRMSSPNRRFSFSLSRMSRSFSFKESSAAPQLSSTYVSVKSGPVRSDSRGFSDDVNKEKVKGHNRTRSSPLRRMLDPLLKSKGLNSFRLSETVQPSKLSLNSSTARPVNANEFIQEEKVESSRIQALLQVTIKNGLPLFSFVVDNGNNMLATSMKSIAASAKGGSDQNFIFSSVSEIKKKNGSWISQGNREKNRGYIYNIIGQMKISDSHISDFTAEDCCNQYLVKESVLFGVEQRQADQASAKFIPNTELAAVVFKMPSATTDIQQGYKEVTKEGFNSTTVILPGGVHSLPNRGVPSPLIERWMSGGLCDCGGWDVGCKLRILSNQNSGCCKISRTSQACLNANLLELYAWGEPEENMPIFSLVPHKSGIYAIEFSSSITALQAFFISVTVISCQKSSDMPEFSYPPEGKVMKETLVNGSLGTENKPTIVLASVPAKYASNPPQSPVGRA